MLEDLKAQIRARRVVFSVGAGVSWDAFMVRQHPSSLVQRAISQPVVVAGQLFLLRLPKSG